MTLVGDLQMDAITSVCYLLIMESRLVKSINRSVMLLQQLLPAIYIYISIASEFFVFQQESAPVHRALEAIIFPL